MGNPYAPPRPDAPQRPRPESPQAPDGGTRPDAPQHPVPPAPPRTGPEQPSGPPSSGGLPPSGGPDGTGDPAEPDPELARLASRSVLHFGLLMLAMLLVSAMPFPWQAASLVFGVVAIVVGVRALVAVWKARVRGVLVPALALGIGLAAMLTLQMAATLVLWDVAAAHQECLDGAITVSAERRCDVERQDALDQTVNRWLPTPGATP